MIYPFESREATKKYDDDKKFLLAKIRINNQNIMNDVRCNNCNWSGSIDDLIPNNSEKVGELEACPNCCKCNGIMELE
jgi:hypothetical protein